MEVTIMLVQIRYWELLILLSPSDSQKEQLFQVGAKEEAWMSIELRNFSLLRNTVKLLPI